jgi:hypothetical protein
VLVEVHAVPTSLAIQGPEAKQTMEDITKQNSTIAGLTVERLAWKRPGRVRMGEKVKSSLIIGV